MNNPESLKEQRERLEYALHYLEKGLSFIDSEEIRKSLFRTMDFLLEENRKTVSLIMQEESKDVSKFSREKVSLGQIYWLYREFGTCFSDYTYSSGYYEVCVGSITDVCEKINKNLYAYTDRDNYLEIVDKVTSEGAQFITSLRYIYDDEEMIYLIEDNQFRDVMNNFALFLVETYEVDDLEDVLWSIWKFEDTIEVEDEKLVICVTDADSSLQLLNEVLSIGQSCHGISCEDNVAILEGFDGDAHVIDRPEKIEWREDDLVVTTKSTKKDYINAYADFVENNRDEW